MNKLKTILIGSMLSLLLSSPLYAVAIKEKIGGVTETGVTSGTYNVFGGRSKEATIFNGYNPGATVVYNNDGGVAATSGWILVSDFSQEMIFHVDLSTLGSTGLDFDVEGLLSDDTSTPMAIFTKSFSATNEGYTLPICEGALKYIRCSIQATGTPAADVITVKFNCCRYSLIKSFFHIRYFSLRFFQKLIQ